METFTHTEGCTTFKHVWNFEHRGFVCEIVVWNDAYEQDKIENMDVYTSTLFAPKWNSYVYVSKKRHPELFEQVKKEKFSEEFGGRTYYEFRKIELHGGETFCRPEFDNDGRIVSYKVGNDFQHIWNTPDEWNFDFVRAELIKSLNAYLDNSEPCSTT